MRECIYIVRFKPEVSINVSKQMLAARFSLDTPVSACYRALLAGIPYFLS